MPISRDARMDRRRRILRDSSEDDAQPTGATRRTSRKTNEDNESESVGGKRKAGYSQDVRKACGQRLVQLIPVRRRSFAAVCLVSLLIPGLLLALHYWIHVTGYLPWWRHPLAVALDVGHPRSIAAWLSSQLWLLCLGATVLTFQLRRHKLDDYSGEYRLWFWLVLTCLVASVDATTSITKLFAQALDRWSQLNMGWTGPAVVDSTLAVLIGMLGLRMCTELKAVPLSLMLWLGGLVSWAGSAALARPELQLEMSAPIRYWLISTLWLGGLTLIWLSALTYLRNVYVEAQQRFLLRGRLAKVGTPLGQRLRESMPGMPRFRRSENQPANEDGTVGSTGRRWRIPGIPQFMRRGSTTLAAGDLANDAAPSDQAGRSRRRTKSAEAETTPASRQVPAATLPATARSVAASSNTNLRPSSSEKDAANENPRRGLGGFLRRTSATSGNTSDGDLASGRNSTPTTSSPSTGKQPISASDQQQSTKKSGWGSWLRRPKDDDQADEYRKANAANSNLADRRAQRAAAKQAKVAQRAEAQEARRIAKQTAAADGQQTGSSRRWLPKISRPTLPKFSRSKPAADVQLKPSTEAKSQPKTTAAPPARPKSKSPSTSSSGSLWSRFKLPSIGLSALRLQPPEEESNSTKTPTSSAPPLRPVSTERPLPGTNSNFVDSFDDEDEDENDSDGRPLSKAERKRMRRLQQQQRRSA